MCTLVIGFQAQSPRLGGDDGGARDFYRPYYDSALGAALCTRIREALEPVRPNRRGAWRMDETYVKVCGQWVYLCRAVNNAGHTVDFFLSQKRDVNAAKCFLRKAMKNTRVPAKITLDAYAASHRTVSESKPTKDLPVTVVVRSSSKYLNNLIEQDYRRIKQRIKPMLDFKKFENAAVTISGIALAEKIKKGQFYYGKLGGRSATLLQWWNATLAT